MAHIILNKIKYYFFLFILIFFSCYNIFSNSFKDLSNAFYKWYIERNPNTFNIIDPYIIYEKNMYGESDYIEQSILDLKRFKLELLQISKKKLNLQDKLKYNSIIRTIDEMLYNNMELKNFYWDVSYYSNISYNHFSNLLFNKDITDEQKSIYISETLELIPKYFNRIKKYINKSTELSLKESNNDINKILHLIDSIHLYVNTDDYTYELIEKKSKKSKKRLVEYLEHIKTIKIDNNILSDEYRFNNSYKNKLYEIQKDFGDMQLIETVRHNIKNLQNKIFSLSLDIYLRDNDEPIWTDREDTLDVIIKVVKNMNKSNNRIKDFDSNIIRFEEYKNEVLEFIDKKQIIDIDNFNISYFDNKNIFHDINNDIELFHYIKNQQINIFYDNRTSNNTEVNSLLIENIIPMRILNLQQKPIIYKDSNLLYTWGKILSRIMIDNGFDQIDSNYELHYNLNLLNDLVMILIEYEYYIENISMNEAVAKITQNSFINIEYAKILWNKIISSNTFLINKYTNWQYLNYLYDYNCIINKKLSSSDFVKKMFKNGFIAIENYQDLLNY